MSIIFSRQCEYALQAVSYMALLPKGDLISIKELSKRLDIPYHFLAKILQGLSSKKLLHSQKGKNGGFGLARNPSSITLFHIVEALDGTDIMTTCVMGFPQCSGQRPCSAHKDWEAIRERVYKMLCEKNIAEMSKEMKRPEYSRIH